jgi:hypothetical protein
MAAASEVNLVLTTLRRLDECGDLEAMARTIRELDPGIHPWVVRDRRQRWRSAALALRPTAIFSWGPLLHFRPLRGAVVQGCRLPKSQEYRRLERHGLPVAEWLLESEATPERLAGFGAYAVVKPNDGRRGHDVRIRRTSRIRPPGSAAAEARDQIVQRFVYTGPWPVSHRVTTLFGEPLECVRFEADRSRRPLAGAEELGQGGSSILVASGQGCRVSLCDDAEVLELARRAHAAWPEIPLLGIDVLREVPSGRLYLSEVNAWGLVWCFAPGNCERLEREHGIRITEQFDGLRLAARILVREARQRAR